jgi:DNA replication protein DnaC
MMFKLEELKVRRRTWVQMANVPKARTGWTLDDCTDIEVKDINKIKKWLGTVESGKVIRAVGSKGCGKGLMFYGTPGHGKTTLALSTIQEIMSTFPLSAFDVTDGSPLIRPCYFITFNDVLNLKGALMDDPTDDQEVIYSGMLGECKNDAYNIRVLVIDDVGKEHSSLSGWQKNMLHHVLRTRFNNGLPTIVTTNVELGDWAGLYGDATESFAHEAFVYFGITSTSGDLRK